MERAPSDDLRTRVLQASSEGLSARQAAAGFRVGTSTAIRRIARRAGLGETTARVQGRRRASSLDAHEAFIVGLIDDRPDITLSLDDGAFVGREIGHHQAQCAQFLAAVTWLNVQKSLPMHWSRSAPTS